MKNYYIFKDITCTFVENNKLCAWTRQCASALQVDNIFAFIRQVAPVPACWLLKTSATS